MLNLIDVGQTARNKNVSYRKQVARHKKIGQGGPCKIIFLSIYFNHHANYGYYFSYRVRTYRRSQENGGAGTPSLEWGALLSTDPVERCPSQALL